MNLGTIFLDGGGGAICSGDDDPQPVKVAAMNRSRPKRTRRLKVCILHSILFPMRPVASGEATTTSNSGPFTMFRTDKPRDGTELHLDIVSPKRDAFQSTAHCCARPDVSALDQSALFPGEAVLQAVVSEDQKVHLPNRRI